MSAHLEDCKAFLKQADSSGISLYDHLTDVLLRVLRDRPKDAVGLFENLSAEVKETRDHATAKSGVLGEVRPLAADAEHREHIDAWVDRIHALHRKPVPPRTDEEEEEEETQEEEPIEVDIPDILQEAVMFRWAGVALGDSDEEVFQVLLAVRALARSKSELLQSVRLFGRVMGTHATYTIVETKLKEYPEPDADEDGNLLHPMAEAPGKGANAFVYFVSTDLQDQSSWVQLPDVLPQQIKLTRQMRRLMTGDLDGLVLGHPHFPWPESHYLRAQIARITAATMISPGGFFAAENEDDPTELTLAEEFSAPDVASLYGGEGWVHHHGHLLMQGRVEKFVPPEQEEDEEEEETEKPEPTEEELEEPKPMLQSITEDVLEGKPNPPSAWTFRVSPGRTVESFSDAVASARCLTWPGAVSVCKVGTAHFANIYVGNGQKFLAQPYTPPPPPRMQQEVVELVRPDAEEAEEETEEEAAVLEPKPVFVECEDPAPPPEPEPVEAEASHEQEEDFEEQEEEEEEG